MNVKAAKCDKCGHLMQREKLNPMEVLDGGKPVFREWFECIICDHIAKKENVKFVDLKEVE